MPSAATVAASASASSPSGPRPSTGRDVCISISCRDLPVTKLNSSTVDPIAAAFSQDPVSKHFNFASQTEWLKNKSNPDFDNLVTLKYQKGTQQIVKFRSETQQQEQPREKISDRAVDANALINCDAY